jgi:hypothetical protein
MAAWFDEAVNGAIIGGIVGAVAGGLAVFAKAIFQPRRKCPDCGELLPRARTPADRQQALSGGSTCSKCGCKIDRKGNRIETPPE